MRIGEWVFKCAWMYKVNIYIFFCFVCLQIVKHSPHFDSNRALIFFSFSSFSAFKAMKNAGNPRFIYKISKFFHFKTLVGSVIALLSSSDWNDGICFDIRSVQHSSQKRHQIHENEKKKWNATKYQKKSRLHSMQSKTIFILYLALGNKNQQKLPHQSNTKSMRKKNFSHWSLITAFDATVQYILVKWFYKVHKSCSDLKMHSKVFEMWKSIFTYANDKVYNFTCFEWFQWVRLLIDGITKTSST